MEISFIMNNLDQICEEKYYERGNGDCKASTLAKSIREQFVGLIDRIENDKESVGEEISRKLNAK